MKYVITGSAGHISKPATEKLLSLGHDVTVVSRNANSIIGLVAQGAKAAIGSVEDLDFLTNTFRDAEAVYTMVPPNFTAKNWKAYIEQIGKNYTAAIKASGAKYVVNLSSVGADLPDGCGPVSGLHQVENALNTLGDVNIKHLRPGFFYINFLANINMVKFMNIIGGNYGDVNTKMILAHPNDIAEVVVNELTSLGFSGHTVRYIASDERTTGDIAKLIGQAIGKPELPWISFSDEQAFGGMKQAGLPEEIAKNYVEMGVSIRTGKMFEDYFKNRPATLGKTKLEDFASEFANAYNNEIAAPAH